MMGLWRHLRDTDEIAQGIPDKPWYTVRNEGEGELYVDGYDTYFDAAESADAWNRYYIEDLYNGCENDWWNDKDRPLCRYQSQKALIENYRNEIDFCCNRG